jgi:hypothetical protein
MTMFGLKDDEELTWQQICKRFDINRFTLQKWHERGITGLKDLPKKKIPGGFNVCRFGDIKPYIVAHLKHR